MGIFGFIRFYSAFCSQCVQYILNYIVLLFFIVFNIFSNIHIYVLLLLLRISQRAPHTSLSAISQRYRFYVGGICKPIYRNKRTTTTTRGAKINHKAERQQQSAAHVMCHQLWRTVHSTTTRITYKQATKTHTHQHTHTYTMRARLCVCYATMVPMPFPLDFYADQCLFCYCKYAVDISTIQLLYLPLCVNKCCQLFFFARYLHSRAHTHTHPHTCAYLYVCMFKTNSHKIIASILWCKFIYYYFLSQQKLARRSY